MYIYMYIYVYMYIYIYIYIYVYIYRGGRGGCDGGRDIKVTNIFTMTSIIKIVQRH